MLALAALGGSAVAADPSFTYAPADPVVGETVRFTAVADCSTAQCEWSGDVSGSGQSVDHRFDAAGERTVTLTVTDGSGETQSSQTVVVRERALPTVELAPATASPQTGESVAFSASAVDPLGRGLGYEWSTDGGGSCGDQPACTLSWPDDGSRTVTVTVTDALGAQAVGAAAVVVRNRPPQVAIVASSLSPLTGEPVTLSADVTDDGDPAVHDYAWTIGERRASGRVVVSAFELPGDYVVTLSVTDEDGNTVAAAPVTISVRNRAPVADFRWEPAVIEKNRPVTFTSTAVDPEGLALDDLAWDLDGDGAYDDAIGPSATATFSDTARHTVGLRVRDAFGASDTLRLTFVPGNRSPVASFTSSPATPAVGQAVTLTATATDADGRIAARDWDLDGDGAYDDGSGPTATVTFRTAGAHRVALKVVDDDGGSDVATRELVAVAPAQPPPIVPERPRGGVAGVRLMNPFPRVRVAGMLVPGGARLTLVTVTAPKGARVKVRCRGRSCRRPVLRARVARVLRLRSLQRVFMAGTVLEFRVTRPRVIGRYTRVVFRDGKIPRRVDRCLWPGVKKPRACPGSR